MAVTDAQLAARYERLYDQLHALFTEGVKRTDDPLARMATLCALLHHKMPHFFWTGFYLLKNEQLVVGPYQGPLACAVLPGPDGVCWSAVTAATALVVPDVQEFAGHVACDSRSKSEVVVPLCDRKGHMVGVLDVDSDKPAAFSDVDRDGLVRILELVSAVWQPV